MKNLLSAIALLTVATLTNAAPPVSYWNFDDGTVTDQVGSNDSISITGATFSANTPGSGGAMSLDLTNGNDFVTLPSTTYGISDAYTISSWVYRSGEGRFFSAMRDFTSGGGSDRSGINLGIVNTDKVFSGVITPSANFNDIDTANLSVAAGQWDHVAVTLRDGFVRMYVNGVPETVYDANPGPANGQLNSTPRTVDFIDNDGSFSGFGADGRNSTPDLFYDGLLDEVSVWNSAISGSEIQQLAAGIAPTSLVTGSDPLDISSSFNADTLATSTTDAAGTGYRGTLNEKFLVSSTSGGNNIPSDGEIAMSDGTTFQLGPFDGDNTVLMGLNQTVAVDLPNGQYEELAVLTSAVGLNTTDDGTITLFYTDGSDSGPLVWDAPDNGNLGSALSDTALDDLDLYRFSSNSTFDARQLFYQTFMVDSDLILDSIEFSTNGISDTGNDAEFGIFAVSARSSAAVPEPSSLVLWLAISSAAVIGLQRRLRNAKAHKKG